MGPIKLCLFLVLIVVAAAPRSSAIKDRFRAYGNPEFAYFGVNIVPASLDKDSGRLLFQYGYKYKYPPSKYISYDALKANNIPCGKRGASYYHCVRKIKANPYTRGCSFRTGCARYTD